VEPGEFGRSSDLDWWLLPLSGGDAIRLNMRAVSEAAGLDLPRPFSWLADGNWVIFDAAQRGGGTRNLWRISISPKEGLLVGEPQKLTAGTGEESPSVSRDGRIAFVNAAEDWDIWSLPIDANRAEVKGDPVRIVSGLSRDLYPSVSADGRKLVYTSDRAGNNDIWLRDLESGKDTPVTVGPANEGRGVISPDGTKVVFGRREQGQVKVYLAELGRGTERLLLENIGLHMDWTPDGKKILYYTTSPIRWKTVDVETGEQRDLGLEHSQYPVHSVRLSPDQNWVSFKLQGAPGIPIFLSRLVGGVAQDESQWIPLGTTDGGGQSWWAPDGNSLYYVSGQDEFICIWVQALDPATKRPKGPPRAFQHFHGRLRLANAAPLGYGITADKHYLPLGETKANIWLAEPQAAPRRCESQRRARMVRRVPRPRAGLRSNS
jgi:Tol biopolymer transport system component